MNFFTKLGRAFFALVFGLWAAGAVALRAWRNDDDGSADIVQRLDKLCAHIKGWGDTYTLSAHCGTPEYRECAFCRRVRYLFVLLRNPDHFEQAARNEHLIP